MVVNKVNQIRPCIGQGICQQLVDWLSQTLLITFLFTFSITVFCFALSLYEGAKTRVRVDSELSEEFEVTVEMHQGSVLSPFLFAVMVGVVTEFT